MVKQNFYKVAKDQKLLKNIEKNIDYRGLIEYYEADRDQYSNKCVDPSLISIIDGKYYLFNRNITIEQSIAIKQFLILMKDIQNRNIKDFAIDICQIEDEALANILEGVASHVSEGLERNYIDIEHHALKCLTISNVTFG